MEIIVDNGKMVKILLNTFLKQIKEKREIQKGF